MEAKNVDEILRECSHQTEPQLFGEAQHLYNVLFIFDKLFIPSISVKRKSAMKNKTESAISYGAHDDAEAATDLKTWVMTILAVAFVLFYGAALIGWIKPLADDRAVAHLEPIIFAIIGYYFGRLPAQRNEKTLKGEIDRQTQKADAAQHAKEQALQAREALEEKVKNARVTLASSAITGVAVSKFADNADEAAAPGQAYGLRQKIVTALEVLNS